MIVFMISIAILTSLFAALIIFVKKKVATSYMGGLLIVMSCFYFSTLFLIAHIMREGFK